MKLMTNKSGPKKLEPKTHECNKKMITLKRAEAEEN
jgi:hypothetical protein